MSQVDRKKVLGDIKLGEKIANDRLPSGDLQSRVLKDYSDLRDAAGLLRVRMGDLILTVNSLIMSVVEGVGIQDLKKIERDRIQIRQWIECLIRGRPIPKAVE